MLHPLLLLMALVLAWPAGAAPRLSLPAGGGAAIDFCGPAPAALRVGSTRSGGQAIAATMTPSPDCPGPRATVSPAELFRYGGLPVQGLGLRLPDYTPPGLGPRTCEIAGLASLRSCLARAEQVDRFVLIADLVCTSAATCCPEGQPLIRLQNRTARLIDGRGHTIRRTAGQSACQAIHLLGGAELVVRDLTLDEDAATPPCELGRPCASTIDAQGARNVRLERVKVLAGKGYVVRVWAVDGFAMVGSQVRDAGMIGVYVGHNRYGPSRNLVFAANVFTGARANALALEGAQGTPELPVLVMDNVFSANHWHGVWPVAGMPTQLTSGGQILLYDAAAVRIRGNVVANSWCGPCWKSHGVTGVELGAPREPQAAVRGVEISGNAFLGGIGQVIYQNPDSRVEGAVLADNLVVGFAALGAPVGPHAARANLVLPAPALPPESARTPGGMAVPVWCARPEAPQAGRVMELDACAPPALPLALAGFAPPAGMPRLP